MVVYVYKPLVLSAARKKRGKKNYLPERTKLITWREIQQNLRSIVSHRPAVDTSDRQLYQGNNPEVNLLLYLFCIAILRFAINSNYYTQVFGPKWSRLVWGKTVYKRCGKWTVKFLYVPWKKQKRKEPRKAVVISNYVDVDDNTTPFEQICYLADDAIVAWLQEFRSDGRHRQNSAQPFKRTAPAESKPVVSLRVKRNRCTRSSTVVSVKVTPEVDHQHPMAGLGTRYPESVLSRIERSKQQTDRTNRLRERIAHAKMIAKRKQSKDKYYADKARKEMRAVVKKVEWLRKRRRQLQLERQVYREAVIHLQKVMCFAKGYPLHCILLKPTADVDHYEAYKEDDVVSVSQKQARKLRRQMTVVLNYSLLRLKRVKMLLSDEWSQRYVKEFETAFPELAVGRILEDVRTTGFLGLPLGRDSTRNAINEYFTHGGFYPDKRGMTTQSWILDNPREKLMFETWLRAGGPSACGKRGRISVYTAQKFINDVMLKDHEPGVMHPCTRLTNPVSHWTAHSWLILCGCKYVKTEKCYFTDRHDAFDTVIDRVNAYHRDRFIELREPVWRVFSNADKERLQDSVDKVDGRTTWPAVRCHHAPVCVCHSTCTCVFCHSTYSPLTIISNIRTVKPYVSMQKSYMSRLGILKSTHHHVHHVKRIQNTGSITWTTYQ